MIHQGTQFTLFVDIPTRVMLGMKAALLFAALEWAEKEKCGTHGELFVFTNEEITELTDIRTAAINKAINTLKNEGYINTTLIGSPPIRHFQIKHYENGGKRA